MTWPTPLASILVPAYNAAPWLAETVESGFAKDWCEKEVVAAAHDMACSKGGVLT
jgi:hypothetical protein